MIVCKTGYDEVSVTWEVPDEVIVCEARDDEVFVCCDVVDVPEDETEESERYAAARPMAMSTTIIATMTMTRAAVRPRPSTRLDRPRYTP